MWFCCGIANCFGWALLLLLLYLTITFTGSYFIRWNYFFSSINHGSRASKKISITFDDAPMHPQTLAVLDVLDKHGVKAAFFLIGKNIKQHEAIVREIHRRGHMVGNHSFAHAGSFPFYHPGKIADDIRQCDERIFEVTGVRPALFRPPFGVTNPRIGAALKRTGHQSIGWSLRSYDTAISNPDKLFSRCTVNLRGGDIVLFHDWAKCTLEVLPKWIAHVKSEGFEIVRLDELLHIEPYR